jgi:transposase
MPKIRKAYKVRLRTNKDTEDLLVRYCGCARFLWNKSLAMNLYRLERGHRILWYPEMAFWLKLWKHSEEYGFLGECPSQVLQQKLMDLDRAFGDCFDRSQPLKRLPVFKKRGRGDKIRFPQGFRIDNRRIFLPKIGWVGFHKSQEIEGTIKNITVTRRADRWYASIQVERVLNVDYRYTSQRCSCCGHTAKENRKSQAGFVCLACGYEDHADVNAAKNILTVGQTGLACINANRSSGRQQEPAGIPSGIAQANREGVLPVAS